MKRKAKNWVIGLGLLSLMSVGIVGGFFLLQGLYFYPGPPVVQYPVPADEREAWQQDLDYFRRYLVMDRSYTDTTRRQANALVETMAERLDSISDAELWLGISRAVALADNGHSNVWSGRRARHFGRIPIRGYWFADGFYILRAKQPYTHLLGSRITHIGHSPMSEVLEVTRQYIGGNPAHRLQFSSFLFEVPALMHAMGLSGSASELTLGVELPDGRQATEVFPSPVPDPDKDPSEYPWKHLSPQALPLEKGEWHTLLSLQDDLPGYLQQIGQSFQQFPLPGINGYYIQFRANNDSTELSIADFQAQARKALADLGPRVIVLDQRFNGGGDYTKTRQFMQDLSGYLSGHGRLYIITGRATFSAGISSVAFARSTADDRSVIVGTQIGDRERAWGETNEFILPNSKLGITFATGLHDYASGCHDWKACYWTDFFHNVAVGSLQPEIPVATRYADYLALKDPVVEKIFEIEQGRQMQFAAER